MFRWIEINIDPAPSPRRAEALRVDPPREMSRLQCASKLCVGIALAFIVRSRTLMPAADALTNLSETACVWVSVQTATAATATTTKLRIFIGLRILVSMSLCARGEFRQIATVTGRRTFDVSVDFFS
jgi:hypothetical protein